MRNNDIYGNQCENIVASTLVSVYIIISHSN